MPRIPWSFPPLTIFSHTFDEGTGGLNDTAVDMGSGNWVSAVVVTADGVFSTAQGSATLAFSPVNGTVYQLDARILNITGNTNWVALGFANGQNANIGNNFRFITTGVVGTAWMLVRGDNSTFPNQSHLGTGALSPINGGTASPNDWTALNNSGGSYDLRILLDTTGGDGNWTATWLGKLIGDSSYTQLRTVAAGAITTAHQANYTSVGFAFSAGGATNLQGTLESFSLTSIPEPSTALLGGLGLLAMMRRRR